MKKAPEFCLYCEDKIDQPKVGRKKHYCCKNCERMARYYRNKESK